MNSVLTSNVLCAHPSLSLQILGCDRGYSPFSVYVNYIIADRYLKVFILNHRHPDISLDRNTYMIF